jgi:prepilin signal peptidase PulO-like enzyme (type II secretory pathway)
MNWVILAVLGIILASVLNWATDYMPRWATRRIVVATLYWRLAIGHVIASVFSQRMRAQLNAWIWWSAAIELLMAVCLVYLGVCWGASIELVMQTLIVAFLILIALIDLKYRLVLNVLIFPACVGIIAIQSVLPDPRWLSLALGGFFGWVVFGAVAVIRPGELGAGDVKLAALIGLLLGFPNVIWALLVGVFAGGVAVLVLLTRYGANSKTQMPYAPFLSLGAILVLLGNSLSGLVR